MGLEYSQIAFFKRKSPLVWNKICNFAAQNLCKYKMDESENDKKALQETSPEQTGEATTGSGSVVDDLMFAELMKGLEETVESHFSARQAVVYRSVSIPAREENMRPRKLRKYESVAQAEAEYEMPPVDELEDWERLKILNQHLGSSVFTNEDGLRAVWHKYYDDKETTSERNRYKRDMGEAIVRLKIAGPEDGLLQNEDEIRDDGHHNFLPSATFKLEEHMDMEYGYNGYMPILDEDIKKLKKDEEE